MRQTFRTSRIPFEIAASTLLLGLLCASAGANPPLANPSFEIVGAGGSPTVHSPPTPGGAGISAADSWGVFHNTAPATTWTELVPTTLPSGGARMIHVETDAIGNGLTQVTGPPFSGRLHGIASAWILTNSGVVGMGSGSHANTSIDIQTTATGAWEYLQAPSGQVPFNTIHFYDQSGGADFYVENAHLLELQDRTSWVSLEYSNRFDENGTAAGGHGGDDPGQVLYTEPIDTPTDANPRDAHDFFPLLEGQFEPDVQVDALAHRGDGGFQDLLANAAPLLVSIVGDPGVAQPVAVYREDVGGALGIEFTQRDLHDLDPIAPGELDDVDALEMWGDTGLPDQPGDADFYSLELDQTAAVWYDGGSGPVAYLFPADILAAINQLGFEAPLGGADVDALMVQDTGSVRGIWDYGDAVLFSIRAANNWDGGEIVYLEFGMAPRFLDHGGHLWDTSFEVAMGFGIPTGQEDVDGLETIPIPEPAAVGMLLCGVSLLGVLGRRRRARPGQAAPTQPAPSVGAAAKMCTSEGAILANTRA
jgi:hypothetical protein